MGSEARQEYWGIPCRSCDEMIGFAKVKYEGATGKAIVPDPKPNPFQEECPHCGFPSFYSAHELIPFEGPATLGFLAHRAFLEY